MLHWALLIAHCTQTRRTHKHTPSTHRHPVHTHRHPVHTLPSHTHSPYSLHTRTAGINTRKKEYIVYITCQSQLRQKSRQIKTYLVVIYGNAYTPCWPAAEQQLSFGFVSFHLSPQFASVCLHCCTPICLPFASLSFFALFPPSFPCPTSLPRSLLLKHSLFVYVRVVAVVPVHTPCSAQHSHSHKSKEISAISKLFFTRHFSVFLEVFL